MKGSDRSSRFSLQTRLIWGALIWVIGALTGAGALSSELLRRQHLADYRAALDLELENVTRTLRFDPQGVVGDELAARRFHAPGAGLGRGRERRLPGARGRGGGAVARCDTTR